MSSSASSAPPLTGRPGGDDDADGGRRRRRGTLSAPADTRLVTIVAHVDHGKTTLADHLVESNGIIGERHAGTLRYLDSDAEEQRRGITMRASAIALRHRYHPPPGKAKAAKAKAGDGGGHGAGRDMVVHLVDSPGHVDFGSEVTSSLLACDGALLVVDVVEGMCARTHAVLREAHANQLVPVLVLNKIDRLCTELHLSVGEAYVRIRELVESVNAASAAMLAASEAAATEEGEDARTGGDGQRVDDGDESSLSSAWNFDPARGNVVFASALHGWGFTIPTLARSLFRSKVLDIKPPALRQFLFGDFRYKADGHKVVKWKQPQAGVVAAAEDEDANAPMFAEFGLRPLWDIYEGVAEAAGTVAAGVPSGVADQSQKTAKITAGSPGMDRVLDSMQLGSTTPASPSPDTSKVEVLLLRTKADVQAVLSKINATSEESVLRALLKRYRPLSDSVLDAACEVCPSPKEATSTVRTRALALREPASLTPSSEGHYLNFGEIRRAVKECDAGGDSPTVAHVCKFMAVKAGDISDPELADIRRQRQAENKEGDMDDNRLMALVRVLSGNLTSEDGVEYEVYGPKYDGGGAVSKKEIKAYLLMGASLVRVKSVPAGHICAVSNLEDLQLKTMTLCDREGGMPLQGFDRTVKPLVKVNVEAAKASETSILEQGLLKLSLADSAVEVTATSKGERLLACQGELHLEQSILDLKQVFCTKPIDLRISDPIVDFGESTDWFEGEGDFTQFFNSQMPPLRQTSLPPYCDEEGLANARHGRCRAILSGRGAAISVRVVPLARSVYECIKEGRVVDGSEEDILYMAGAIQCPSVGEAQNMCSAENFVSALSESACSFDSHGNCIVESLGVAHGDCVKAVVSNAGQVYMPPKQIEPSQEETRENGDTMKQDGMHEDVNTKNLRTQYEVLQERIRNGTHPGGFDQDIDVNGTGVDEGDADEVAADLAARSIWSSEMRGSAVAGFQLAMRAGPLCEEPIKGVMVILEAVEIAMVRKRKKDAVSISNDSRMQPTFAPAQPISGGMVVSAICQGIRLGLLTRPARIVEGHVRLTLHSSLSALGPIYAVLSKRRGKVISDEMVDGTDLLSITAALPQRESFGLFQELLRKTSGDVTAPELVFSHYELLKEDPFWIPTSEDEREEFGEIVMNGDASTGVANNALSIIRCVRKRKGLLVDSTKIVVAAEKQRTLARKK